MSNIAIHRGLIGIGWANAWDIILNQNIVHPKNNTIKPIIENVPIATNASVIFVIAFEQLMVPVLPKQETNIVEIDENKPSSVGVTTFCGTGWFVLSTVHDDWGDTGGTIGLVIIAEELAVVDVFVATTGTWIHQVEIGDTFGSSGQIDTSVPSSTHIRHAVVSTNRAL